MKHEGDDLKKLSVLLGYWIEHNREHIAENRMWMERALNAGLHEVVEQLGKVIELSEEMNHRMEMARRSLIGRVDRNDDAGNGWIA